MSRGFLSLLVFVVVINVTVIALRMSRRRDNPLPPVQEKLDLDRGAVAQRQRIDEFTEKVGSSSLEELELSLANFELTVSVPGVGPGPADGINYFPAVLADRRVARLFQEYNSANDAKQRVERLSEHWLKEHTDRIGRVVDAWKASSAIDIGIDLRGSNHACAAYAFLLCEFSDNDTVLQYLRRWEEAGKDGMSNIEANSPGAHPIEVVVMPGDLYVFNLCLLMAQRKLTQSDFVNRLQHDINIPPGVLTVVPFSEWDAHTNVFDFTHVSKGVPYDPDRVIGNYAFLNSFETVSADSKEPRIMLRARAEQLVTSLTKS